MNQSELIISLFKYYSKFVNKNVLKKMFTLPESSQRTGYAQVESEMINTPSSDIIPSISSYVFSMNEKFVSDKVRNNKDIILYVEYGMINYNPTVMHGTRENLAVYVAYPYNMANNDNLNEALLMEQMLSILKQILNTMQKDQSDLDFCGDTELIKFPAEIVPIESYTFYDHIGWMGIFDYSETNLI